MAGCVFVGTSGWNYKAWGGGLFYPAEVKPNRWLDYYTQHFNSVEVNNTFYHLPQKSVFEAWRTQTPDSFRFAIKASRFVTHMKKLIDPAEHVALFLKRAAGLKEKLEVVLFQLPPFWKFNRERLVQLGAYLCRQRIIPCIRAALEVRNPSWMDVACFDVLREFNIALAFADWPSLKVSEPITADFVFVRRHGPEGLYASNYSAALLATEARKIQSWRAAGRDVYVYFNNDVHGYAVKNAGTLKKMLSG